MYKINRTVMRSWARFIKAKTDDERRYALMAYETEILRINGYVYLVHMVGTGYYKIGVSIQPHERMRTFKIKGVIKMPFDSPQNPTFSLIHTIKTNDMYAVEKHFHEIYHEQRIYHPIHRTEWFMLTQSQIAEISAQNAIYFNLGGYDFE